MGGSEDLGYCLTISLSLTAVSAHFPDCNNIHSNTDIDGSRQTNVSIIFDHVFVTKSRECALHYPKNMYKLKICIKKQGQLLSL